MAYPLKSVCMQCVMCGLQIHIVMFQVLVATSLTFSALSDESSICIIVYSICLYLLYQYVEVLLYSTLIVIYTCMLVIFKLILFLFIFLCSIYLVFLFIYLCSIYLVISNPNFVLNYNICSLLHAMTIGVYKRHPPLAQFVFYCIVKQYCHCRAQDNVLFSYINQG